ncbi:MAG: hypothetical protein AB7L92_07035 [Alphaproteobacteria bacterium]
MREGAGAAAADGLVMFSLMKRTFQNKEDVLLTTEVDLDYLGKLRRKDFKRKDRSREFNILTEYYNLTFYLRALALNEQLDYPVTYKKSESPDFIINDSVGIEISRVTEGEYQKWLGDIESIKGVHIFNSTGYMGNEPEKSSIDLISKSIEKKLKKISTYKKKVKQVRLLLRLETDIIIDEDEFSELLNRTFIFQPNQFNEISILVGETIFQRCSNKKLFKRFEVPRSLEKVA